MGRAWAPPVRKDTFNLILVSDMHHGRRTFSTAALSNAARSLDQIAKSSADRIIDVGDGIHWRLADSLQSDNAALVSWVAGRRALTGKPVDLIAGNHCLRSYGTPQPGRTGDQWARDVGLPSRNTVIDHEDWCRLVLMSPTEQSYSAETGGHAPMVITPADFDWLRARAREVPKRRVFVFFHAPIQYGGHMNWEDARAAISGEPNIVAWVSGHRHMNPDTDSRAFINLTWDAKTIHAINLPSFGGVMDLAADDRWGQPFHATLLSILPEGGVELRILECMTNVWVPYMGQHVIRLPPAPAP